MSTRPAVGGMSTAEAARAAAALGASLRALGHAAERAARSMRALGETIAILYADEALCGADGDT